MPWLFFLLALGLGHFLLGVGFFFHFILIQLRIGILSEMGIFHGLVQGAGIDFFECGQVRLAPLDAADDGLGAVEVRGPAVFDGYLNRPDATEAATTADGWFATGDIGRWTPSGALALVGRRATGGPKAIVATRAFSIWSCGPKRLHLRSRLSRLMLYVG